ncbi:MAG: hypothetical protein IPG75_17050 [Gemmatimonadetes bacterium]|nr:hypothetical protein [Gemmatimonadota bacterium]
MLATLRQDLRLAARLLWSSPLFTLVAVACIAIGSGAVTTIVSAGNAMVLRPLAGSDDGSRLIRIERKRPGGSDGVSLPTLVTAAHACRPSAACRLQGVAGAARRLRPRRRRLRLPW